MVHLKLQKPFTHENGFSGYTCVSCPVSPNQFELNVVHFDSVNILIPPGLRWVGPLHQSESPQSPA